MPRLDPPSTEELEHLLKRDATRIRAQASPDFAGRLQGRLAVSSEPLPYPGPGRSSPWPWYAVAAAAILLVSAGILLLPEASSPSTMDQDPAPVVLDLPQTPSTTAPSARPPSLEAISPPAGAGLMGAPLAAIDFNPFSAMPTTPLDAELQAIRHDMRSTGTFLLACLPGYPAPNQ